MKLKHDTSERKYFNRDEMSKEDFEAAMKERGVDQLWQGGGDIGAGVLKRLNLPKEKSRNLRREIDRREC